ncbi:MAG: pilus assembly protein TadG-related protein [Gammaproteobacteria bacterium]|nr:pilus assembly protein TadG-related protein [Gammaproteobacteria bacterium]
MIKCQGRPQGQKKQRGFVVVMLVLVIAILLGVAALALDLGRLYVLKSEMQNAADAAALAGAAELNAKSDAIERAELAAKGLLAHNSHFAKVKELLGSNVEIDITFYCSIGGSQDAGAICDVGVADPDDSNKIIIPSEDDDVYVHYIRVTLNPESVDDEGEDNKERYGIDLYFLPVLSVIGIDTSKQAVTTATALAGRHFYFCNYPPVMMCDPFEGVAGGMRENIEAGQQILLKAQSSAWAPGDFAFLDLDRFPGGGAGDAMHALADEGSLGCTPPLVLAEPGGMTNKTAAGINTRFGEYGKFGLTADDYPPSPNVTSYGGYDDVPQSAPGEDGKIQWRDENLQDLDAVSTNRIGNGEWDRDDYFTTYHSGVIRPAGWASMSRKQVYNWELSSDNVPVSPDHTPGSADRRVFFVAVLSCNALNVHGASATIPIREPDGFAELFITERVAGPPDTNVLVEFMDWASEEDANYHVTVQLYE